MLTVQEIQDELLAVDALERDGYFTRGMANSVRQFGQMALAFAQLVEVAKEAKNQKSFFSDHYEGPDTYCCCKLEDALWSQDPIPAVAALHKEATDA